MKDDCRPPKHRRKRSQRWFLARGIHRRVVSYLLVAVMIGLVGGWTVHVAHISGNLTGLLCAIAVVMMAMWPLGWRATFRIARPVSELAEFAGNLQRNRVDGASDGREVEQVAETLRELAERLTKQVADQQALMAAVSHELRSPLARTRVLVELSREGHAPETLHDDLQDEVDGMDSLVGDLLAAARIDFEAIAIRTLGVADLVARSLEIARLVDVELEIPEALTVQGDPTLLARALSGLIDNGQHHGTGVERIVVTHTDAWVRIAVHDVGKGFADGEAEAVFQPFWRRPGTPRGGTGLGLALVRQIAEAHGGRAGAENAAGGVVWLEVPKGRANPDR